VGELEIARAASAASEKELDRLRKLFTAGANASAQAVEVAEANVARDRATVNVALAKLRATWGGDVAQKLDSLNEAFREGASLARLDLLPGETTAAAAKLARVSLAGGHENFEAEILGAAPVADAQGQGAGFLVLVRKQSLPAGAALRGTMPGAGQSGKVLVLPRGAVVYHQGSAWVFVFGEEDTFERKLVKLGPSIGEDSVAVEQGLDASEQVVATGAQQLLAAELQAGGAPAAD
jgi:hypothetical protein